MTNGATSDARYAPPTTGARTRTVTDAVLGPVSGAPQRLLSWQTLFRLIGPGSVPLAVLFLGVSVHLVRTEYAAEQPVVFLFVVAQSVAVVLSRYRPVIAWVLALVSFWPVAQLTTPGTPGVTPWPWLVPGMLGYYVVQYAIARYRRRWLMVSSYAAAVSLTVAVSGAAPDVWTSPELATFILLSAAAALAGDVNRIRHEAHLRVLEEERQTAQERARRETLEERSRIARELHDVVAHHMSVIAVQASTATYRLDDLPPGARRELESIAGSARESLTEMRRLLGVLRADEAAAERTPQPGLATLEQLVDATERAGIPVEYSVRAMPAELPPSIDLTAYRIVQEALSNVVRHAPGAGACVEIAGEPQRLVVRVTNTAPTEPPEEQPGAGHGLMGMSERVEVLGGEITAGPLAGGGFQVDAAIPLRPSAVAVPAEQAGQRRGDAR